MTFSYIYPTRSPVPEIMPWSFSKKNFFFNWRYSRLRKNIHNSHRHCPPTARVGEWHVFRNGLGKWTQGVEEAHLRLGVLQDGPVPEEVTQSWVALSWWARGPDTENSLSRASAAWGHSLPLTPPTTPLPTHTEPGTQAGSGEGLQTLWPWGALPRRVLAEPFIGSLVPIPLTFFSKFPTRLRLLKKNSGKWFFFWRSGISCPTGNTRFFNLG